jgi:type II secretory pathway component PulF
MIAAGELTGSLDRCIEYLAETLQREFELNNKIREITRYPKIVLAGMGAAVITLMSFVVPRYVSIFEKAKLKLPFFTEALIWLNALFQDYWLAGVELAVVGAVGARLILNTEKGRMIYDGWVLKAPVTGDVLLKIALAQWSNILGNLIRAGIPIIRALAVSSRAAGNQNLAVIINQVACEVSEGSGLAEPLRRHKIIPPIVAQMVAAGEKSGSLDDMLFKVSDFLGDDARRQIRKIAVFTESALIVSLGLLVLFLALSIFLPMWDITKMARGG